MKTTSSESQVTFDSLENSQLVTRLRAAEPSKVNEHRVFAQCDLLKIFERDMRLAADMIEQMQALLDNPARLWKYIQHQMEEERGES